MKSILYSVCIGSLVLALTAGGAQGTTENPRGPAKQKRGAICGKIVGEDKHQLLRNAEMALRARALSFLMITSVPAIFRTKSDSGTAFICANHAKCPFQQVQLMC